MKEASKPLLLSGPDAQADETILKNAKWLYFTLNMALYSSLTFTSAYFFIHWHVPIYQFGFLSALSMVELVGAVWWGSLADGTGRHRRILITCTSTYCALFCGLPIGGWLLPGDDAAGLKMVTSAVLLGGTFFFMSAFFPLVDSCVLGALKRRVSPADTHTQFGRQRLWGTLGHGAVSLLSGQAISAFGWIGMFGVLLVTCASFIGCTFFILSDSDSDSDCHDRNAAFEVDSIDKNEEDRNSESEVDTITITSTIRVDPASSATEKSPNATCKFIWLLAIVLVAGWMRSVLSTFLPYHLLFDWHQSPLFVGLTAIFRISTETLLFAGWHRPGGFNELALLRLGLLASVLRVAGYAALTPICHVTPLWLAVFLLESLKGVSVACIVSGAARLAHTLLPPPQSTRAQAYVSGTYSGLATAVAGVAGGAMIWGEAEHSIAAMFAWTALIGGLFLILIEVQVWTNKLL